MSDDVRRITFIYLVEVSSVDNNIACQFIPRICKIWVENKLNVFSNTYLHTLTTNVECAQANILLYILKVLSNLPSALKRVLIWYYFGHKVQISQAIGKKSILVSYLTFQKWYPWDGMILHSSIRLQEIQDRQGPIANLIGFLFLSFMYIGTSGQNCEQTIFLF